ncbi:MAG: hypothetical protein ACK4PI_12785 [Tepidisphaerales bacterium]
MDTVKRPPTERNAARPADAPRPPDDLPTDPARFFRAAAPPPPTHPPASPANGPRPGLPFLSNPSAAHAPGPSGHGSDPCDAPVSALDRLGASPLPKTGFPFIGFLAGVYEHVAAVARGEPPKDEP